ncbi:23S rRNA (guanosine(2251)-2'-O)-methyltransferase RlmB [Atopobacter sp. AH10]|uniref:23S rRNA (guanosine(2251)-2'-O)-methyltransferase RlmB n=1 Tax=Atopobacter sp. AH10 TaxID=2315861 RepID=UPI000EF1C528|nr:23S rRNA (guanosine(2251)-2'-O)-methyltransferase RlmB [Atopobacter sp. AH10]
MARKDERPSRPRSGTKVGRNGVKSTFKSKKRLIKANDNKEDNLKKGKESGDFSSEMIYGKHAVHAALTSEVDFNKLFVQDGLSKKDSQTILKLAKEKGLPIQFVPKTKLAELSHQAAHQGFVLSRAAYSYQPLEAIFDLADELQAPPFIIMLDGIEDPHNLGSILRTADAVGCHGIIIPKHRSVSLTGTVAKVSTGAIEHVPVVRVTNLSQTLETLKARGCWIFGTDMQGESYTEWDATGPLVLVIGNEGKGMSPLVKKNCDQLLTLPMIGHVQSLNASVACGVLAYEVLRKRKLS